MVIISPNLHLLPNVLVQILQFLQKKADNRLWLCSSFFGRKTFWMFLKRATLKRRRINDTKRRVSSFSVSTITISSSVDINAMRTVVGVGGELGGTRERIRTLGVTASSAFRLRSVLLYIHKQRTGTISYLLPTSDIRAACFISKHHLSFHSFHIYISTGSSPLFVDDADLEKVYWKVSRTFLTTFQDFFLFLIPKNNYFASSLKNFIELINFSFDHHCLNI